MADHGQETTLSTPATATWSSTNTARPLSRRLLSNEGSVSDNRSNNKSNSSSSSSSKLKAADFEGSKSEMGGPHSHLPALAAPPSPDEAMVNKLLVEEFGWC